MTTYKIVRPDGYHRQNDEMLALLGFKKLPDEGMQEQQVVGVRNFRRGDKNAEIAHITVWVTPLPADRKRSMNGSRPHRLMCRCPGCNMEMSVGRLHQHVCKEGAR